MKDRLIHLAELLEGQRETLGALQARFPSDRLAESNRDFIKKESDRLLLALEEVKGHIADFGAPGQSLEDASLALHRGADLHEQVKKTIEQSSDELKAIGK
jgi:hypothetical protein